MMNDESMEILPFTAINDFMRDDYRLEVVRSALLAIPNLPPGYRERIDPLTRRLVQIPGFRNSAKAPVARRFRPTAESFTKSPQLVAAIVSAWAEAHAELRRQVFELLSERGWELLPEDTDRTLKPGFSIRWPHGEDFDTLYQSFQARYPQSVSSSDDVNLMVVWLGVRLPVDTGEENEEDNLE